MDFGKTAELYDRYRRGFPLAAYKAFETRGWIREGLDAVDLGTGTGTVALELARRGCRVVGVDLSPNMIAHAVLGDIPPDRLSYKVGRAESTGLPDGCADLVTAGQCWHWFNGTAAAKECLRLLRPGGRVVIMHFDWLPLSGNVVSATEALIEKHNPLWRLGGGLGVYPLWFKQLQEAGCGGIESFTFDEKVEFDHEGWVGRIRASAGVGGSMSKAAIEAFEVGLHAMLRGAFPEEPLQVPHRFFAVSGIRTVSIH